MRKAPPSAFSLVELLVCIAVVAILAGLIFAGSQRSMKSAKNLACMSNLKQLASAMLLYANDHEGWLVPPKEGPVRWSERLAAYLKGDSNVEVIPTANRGLKGTILECPAETSSRLQGLGRGGTDSILFGYAMNLHLPPNSGIEERKSRMGVEQPSQTALLMDSTQGTVTYYGAAVGRVKEAQLRHDHVHVLMLDGSAQAFDFERDIPKNDSVNTNTPKANGRAFWRGF